MNVEMLTDVNMKVDQLLSVRRQIETLEKEEKALKEEIVATGLDEIEGYNCKAVITHVAASKTTDYKAICTFLKVQDNVINRFKKDKAAYDIVNIRPL